jgi:UDP-N-acetylmuramate: L-alanyl-gamma-D-glutamyl-meso-diaminopimelate ligase
MTKPGQPWFIRRPMPANVQSVHLLGIAGSGVGTFAMMLRDAGYTVRGSDQNVYPPMSDRLTAHGIEWYESWDPAHLDWAPDLVVVGNVCRRDNLEAVAADERGISCVSFPQALSDLFLARARPAVIAGTHGKTTTTALVTHLMDVIGLAPGFLLGGVAKNFSSGYRLSHESGGPFVVEGDEYDTAFFDKGPKFLHYRPSVAVLNNIEFDHADIYDDLDEIIENFDRLMDLMSEGTTLVANMDDPLVVARSKIARGQVRYFGLNEGANVRAGAIEPFEGGVRFELFIDDFSMGTVMSPMSGAHNVSNVLAAFSVCEAYGADWRALIEALVSFKGTDKRQDEKGTFDGVLIVDDFAHHPTAIETTLVGLKQQYGQRRLWAVYEPKSNTARRNIHQTAYETAFLPADQVLIATPYQKDDGLKPEDMLDVAYLTQALTDGGTPASSPGDAEAIRHYLVEHTQPGDVVVVMANSGFDGLIPKLISALSAR